MRTCFLLLVLVLPGTVYPQISNQPNSSQIQLKLKKLNFLGSVLYMAAHPDDENTNIIAYMSNDRLASTAYLALTRGDGGQNLIGPEIRELLGLIRTQELLAARRIDGGQQFFTRAIDFGFSKSADEAFSIWGKEAVLSDAVRILRQFQPDVIITRFPPDARAGHGHHTASAIVAAEAFDAAANPQAFPDQTSKLGTWQVKRLYTNTGRWWNQTINADTPGIITLDVGGYNPLLGKSYSEISALSSSQHKSQGWGRSAERGYRLEFLEYAKGERAEKTIFDGIDTTWKRLRGGEKIQPLVTRAINEFEPANPAASVPLLLNIRDQILTLDKSVWKDRKLRETEQLIQDCLGLFADASASHYQSSPGEPVKASIEIINRSATAVSVEGIHVSGSIHWDSLFSASLADNRPLQTDVHVAVNADAQYSDPYWLRYPHGTGLYTVNDKEKIGMPEDRPAVIFSFDLLIAGKRLSIQRPLVYKWVDPVRGEVWRPFEIVPPVSVNLSENVLVFGTPEPKQVTLVVRSSSDRMQSGTVALEVPKGWKTEPSKVAFTLPARGSEQTTSVTVYPSPSEYNGAVKAVATVDGKRYDHSLRVISYEHIPAQTLLPPAEAKAVRIDLKKSGELIGYIRGAGDDIPAALRNMGYSVVELDNGDITLDNLKRFDAVVLGVRALNTNDRAAYFMPAVLAYVKQGGTAVVQYNTTARLETDEFAPFPITISHDRVTDEHAEVRILKPSSPVMNSPNKITPGDFDGWIQERGLYFPSKWDDRYEAILSMNDKGESPMNSSLLVAKVGSGYYVYTGLSFFRELPEGVPGAYKLFANLVSLGNSKATTVGSTRNRSK
jgi:LmbE family N-acetylglucosaminyl deacetylase